MNTQSTAVVVLGRKHKSFNDKLKFNSLFISARHLVFEKDLGKWSWKKREGKNQKGKISACSRSAHSDILTYLKLDWFLPT